MARSRRPRLNGDVPENLPAITRPRSGAMIGGVAAGLARRWQIDPNLLRIAFAVLTVISGIGVAAYAVGWLILPREGAVEAPIHRLVPFTRSWDKNALLAVLIAAAAVITLTVSGGSSGFGLLLLAAVIWLIVSNRKRQAGSPGPAEPTPYERAAENWRNRLVEQQVPGFVNAPQPPAGLTTEPPQWQQPYTDPTDEQVLDYDPPPANSPKPHRWRRWLPVLALVGCALLAVTGLGVVFGLPMTTLAYSAAILGALGLGLLGSVRSGRPPLLLATTILSALLTGSLLAGASGLEPQIGERSYSYVNSDALPSELRLDSGRLEVDLSDLRLESDAQLELQLGAGELAVTLPDSVRTEVEWSIGAGEYLENDEVSMEGFQISGNSPFGSELSGPVLHLTVSVTAGEVNFLHA